MASKRQRAPRNPRNTATQAEPTTNTNTATEVATTQGERKMAGLTPDQIASLLGSSRTKGQYTTYLTDFVNSGEAGVCANEEWVDLKDKKASTLKQGFQNAKDKKDAPAEFASVRVLVNDEKVYLINTVAAGIATEDEAES